MNRYFCLSCRSCFRKYTHGLENQHPTSYTIVTGRSSSAAIIRAGQENTKQNTNTFHKIYKHFTIFTQIFDWFPTFGRLRVSPLSLGTHGETIHNDKSYV